MSTVYMICGNTAAGKSTYSKKLAQQKNTVLFSIDTWMQNLFSADYNPETHKFTWLSERIERCEIQMRETAKMILKQNIDIILDFGFGNLESRNFYRKWAKSLGAIVSLHFLDVSIEIRRKQVHKRNKEKGSTFIFEVTDQMFDYLETMFVPPSEDELLNGFVIK